MEPKGHYSIDHNGWDWHSKADTVTPLDWRRLAKQEDKEEPGD